MDTEGECTQEEERVLKRIFHQIGEDLSMLVDHELGFDSVHVEVANERPAGRGSIHISFKLRFTVGSSVGHGCLLVPLPDAVSLAAYLLEIPEEGISQRRSRSSLDEGMKDAMVEIGNMVGGSTGTALRALGMDDVKERFIGCQGVREGVRPALQYEEGSPLLVGRARGTLTPFPTFDVILFLPRMPGLTEKLPGKAA